MLNFETQIKLIFHIRIASNMITKPAFAQVFQIQVNWVVICWNSTKEG